MNDLTSFHKRCIMHSFDRSASSYDYYSHLQYQVGLALIQDIKKQKIFFPIIADIGCGTGRLTTELDAHFLTNAIFPLDLSPKMIGQCQKKIFKHEGNCLIADFDALPFTTASIDLLFSNMTLQWSTDIAKTLVELLRCVTPGGFLAFTVFVDDTLEEFRNFLNINSFYASSFIDTTIKTLPVDRMVFLKNTFYQRFSHAWDFIDFFRKTGANYSFEKKKFSTIKKNYQKWIALNLRNEIMASFKITTCILRKL